MGSYNPDCHTGTKKKTFFLIMSKFFANILFVSFLVLAADASLDCKKCQENEVCKWTLESDKWAGGDCVPKLNEKYPCVVKDKDYKIRECYTLPSASTTASSTASNTASSTPDSNTASSSAAPSSTPDSNTASSSAASSSAASSSAPGSGDRKRRQAHDTCAENTCPKRTFTS